MLLEEALAIALAGGPVRRFHAIALCTVIAALLSVCREPIRRIETSAHPFGSFAWRIDEKDLWALRERYLLPFRLHCIRCVKTIGRYPL